MLLFVFLFGGRVLVLVRVIASVRARVRCFFSVVRSVFLLLVNVIVPALVRCSWACQCSCSFC